MNLNPIQRGQSIPLTASTWNVLMEMARHYQKNKLNFAGEMAGLNRQTGIVRVRNSTGGDLDRGHIIGVDAPLIEPTANEREFQNTLAFDGVTAELTDHFHRMGVLLEPIADGQIGRVVIDGIAHARITGGGNDVTVAGPDGDGLLHPSYPGVQVLWRDTDWAIVRFSEDYRVEGFLLQQLAHGGSADLDVWGHPNGTWETSGAEVTVNWPPDVGPPLAAGIWMLAVWINGEWRPVAADCEEEVPAPP